MNIGIYQPYEEAVVSAFTGMSALMASISLSVGIISIVSMWMIFEKASEPGWKCLIPIYNLFIFFKITWLNGWYFLLMFIPLVNTTEIDLLMICRRGIFVFESKNYSGWIFGKESQQKWTQTLPHGRGSYKEHFYNPVLQNKGHLQALQNYIGAEVPLWSIIVFSERCTLKNVQVTSPNISVVNRYDLFQEVTMRLNRAPAVFSEEDVERVYAFLYPCSQVSAAVKAQHIENITSH